MLVITRRSYYTRECPCILCTEWYQRTSSNITHSFSGVGADMFSIVVFFAKIMSLPLFTGDKKTQTAILDNIENNHFFFLGLCFDWPPIPINKVVFCSRQHLSQLSEKIAYKHFISQLLSLFVQLYVNETPASYTKCTDFSTK